MQPRTDGFSRRPIASRDRALFRRMAARIAAAGVSPNAISVGGMVCGILAGLALGATPYMTHAWLLWVAAIVFIQARLLANLFDGMVAVEHDRRSPMGEIYNDAPDRVSDSAVLIGLGYALGGEPVLGWACACLAMMTAYIRVVGACAGAGHDFRGPMAKQHRMFVVTLAAIAAAFAPDELWGPEGRWGIASVALWIIAFGTVLTGANRLRFISRKLREGAS